MSVRVKLIGGLGNQLFQYAAGLALAKYLNSKLLVDKSNFKNYKTFDFQLDKMNISGHVYQSKYIYPNHKVDYVLSYIKSRLKSEVFYQESAFSFNNKWDSLKEYWLKGSKSILLNGYFQSPNYFEAIKLQLQSEFTPREALYGKNLIILEDIKTSNSVMLHIRRGDYVSNKSAHLTHGVCTISYYQDAIDIISNQHSDMKFFIFSDDLEWAKVNLKMLKNTVFVDGNKGSPEIDLYLMRMCKHHIIANSTFSWWASWLSTNDNGTKIYPQPWFNIDKINSKDLIPASWIGVNK